MAEVPLEERYTPDVLQNSGVPVETREGIRHVRFRASHMARAEALYDGIRAQVPVWEETPVVGPDGAALVGPDGPVVTRRQVGREERVFYGQEALQKAMDAYPTDATLKLLALVWDLDVEGLDDLVDVEKIPDYQLAVSVAWSMAQGVDPTSAGRVIRSAMKNLGERRAGLVKDLESRLSSTTEPDEDGTTASPGHPGPEPGPLPAEG